MTITIEPLTLIKLSRGDDRLLHEVWQIRTACAHDLHHRFGDGHWAKVSPLAPLRRVVREKHVYAVRWGGETVATFSLSQVGPYYLTPDLFDEPTARAAYLTALAVRPRQQHHGAGRWCMSQAEALARSWGCRSLRFDAYDHPAGAWAFYDRGGYARCGVVNVYGVRLIAYERVLMPAA
ncbi:GNAT family N-acetyltransferase [Phycisphaerales bacterium AB-hyl4]|uniref:GNAT family N-acetyltransferase n=1 Tax=Natronomicrosphaera hydrolytica TaxID=3242702 RepID=A0ABV4U0G3_9BACT